VTLDAGRHSGVTLDAGLYARRHSGVTLDAGRHSGVTLDAGLYARRHSGVTLDAGRHSGVTLDAGPRSDGIAPTPHPAAQRARQYCAPAYDQQMTDPCVKATVQIAADPQKVYELITDLPTLASLAEEANAMEWRKGTCVGEGAVFVGHNENKGKRWSTKCTVTDADPGRMFAFDVRHSVFPVSRWQYDIVANDGGCEVTESTWDRRPGWFAKLAGRATGTPDRAGANAEHIRLTLERLKRRAEAG
jgi:uncharacterized protein YndB with AHSA1/START domain